MTVSIRPVDFQKDRSVLVTLLKGNRELADDYPFEKRFDWLYLDNPHGTATGWMVAVVVVTGVGSSRIAKPRGPAPVLVMVIVPVATLSWSIVTLKKEGVTSISGSWSTKKR